MSSSSSKHLVELLWACVPERVKSMGGMKSESRAASRRKVLRTVGYTVLAAAVAYGLQRVLRTEKERLWRKMKSLLESLEVWSGLLGRSKNLLHGLLEELQSYLHSNEQNLPPKLEKLFRIAESEQTLHCIRMWSRAIVEGAVSATSCSSLPEGSAKLAGSSSEASESGSLLRIGDLVESLASKAIKRVLELVDRESSESHSPSSSDLQGCQAQTSNGQSLLSVALRLLKREDGQRLFCNVTAAAVAAGTETYLKLRTSENGRDDAWSRVASVISATEHRDFVLECVSSITNSLMTQSSTTVESLREDEAGVGPELEYCRSAGSGPPNYAFGQYSYSSDLRPKSPVCDPAYGHALTCEHQVYTTSHCPDRVPIFNGVQSERALNTPGGNHLRELQSDTSRSRRHQWESASSAIQVSHQGASQGGHPGVTSSVMKIVSVLSEKPEGRQLLVDITRGVVRDVTKSGYESLVQSGSQSFRKYSSVVLPGVFTTIVVAVLHAYTLALTAVQ